MPRPREKSIKREEEARGRRLGPAAILSLARLARAQLIPDWHPSTPPPADPGRAKGGRAGAQPGCGRAHQEAGGGGQAKGRHARAAAKARSVALLHPITLPPFLSPQRRYTKPTHPLPPPPPPRTLQASTSAATTAPSRSRCRTFCGRSRSSSGTRPAMPRSTPGSTRSSSGIIWSHRPPACLSHHPCQPVARVCTSANPHSPPLACIT